MEINQNCRGCTACYYFCHQNAITMVNNQQGFMKAIVDSNLCVKCGKCIKVCDERKFTNMCKGYLAYSINDKIRLKSSSGGLFAEMARMFLKNSGIVYGAAFNDENMLKHKRVENQADLESLLGSKYLQSELDEIFLNVEQDLTQGKHVLFSGTPCQITGLYSFLKKDYMNLYTIDIICHGVPSPKIWNEYLLSIKKNNKCIKKINFRDKKTGWHRFSFSYEIDGKKKSSLFIDNPFCFMFDKHYSLSEHCFECEYSGKQHPADITLGDFWGVENFSYLDDNKGVSLVTINTNKGEELILNCENLILKPVNVNEAMSRNLTEPPRKPKNYNDFWHDYYQYGFKFCEKKYFYINKWRKMKLFVKKIFYRSNLIKYFIK